MYNFKPIKEKKKLEKETSNQTQKWTQQEVMIHRKNKLELNPNT